MKINHIAVNNILGLHHIEADINSPITIFAGNNGAGKSSLQQAVRLALTGQPARIKLKKDYSKMVADGHKKGSVQLFVDDSQAPFSFSLPDGDHKYGSTLSFAVNHVLDPALFCSLKDDERRNALFALTGIKINTEAVRERLTAREVNMDLAEKVLPLLRSGFPAAKDTAATNATEAKGAWKATTGETWGSKKADGWAAVTPAMPDEKELDQLRQQLTALDTDITGTNEQYGALVERHKQHQEQETQLTPLQALAESLDDEKELLEAAKAEFDQHLTIYNNLQERAAEIDVEHFQPCPECQTKLVIFDGQIQRAADSPPIDQEAIDQLPAQSNAVKALKQVMDNHQEKYDKASAAVTTLENRHHIEAVDQGEFEQCKGKLAALNETKDDLKAQLSVLEAQETECKKAAAITENAGKFHQQVTDWLVIADAFAPDGIPGELLNEAMEPFNNRLRDSATATGWKQVSIGGDMSIEYGRRPYELLSESEQWRVDAMIAEAISNLSGLNLLMLDRFDVLDIGGRGALLKWLEGLASASEIDTALLFGTLKNASYQSQFTQSVWLKNGSTGKVEQAA